MDRSQKEARNTAVILLSGGIDSCVLCALAKSQGYRVNTISFDYGQSHKDELQCAKKIAQHYQFSHKLVKVDYSFTCGFHLIDRRASWERKKTAQELLNNPEISRDYLPARNTIFLSYALALAETTNAHTIFYGANLADRNFPDCTENYVEGYNLFLQALAQSRGPEVKLQAPFLDKSKIDIIKLALLLKAPLELTLSCYHPISGIACNQCNSCSLRKNAFAQLGIHDPATI